jgi:hypothetical protein
MNLLSVQYVKISSSSTGSDALPSARHSRAYTGKIVAHAQTCESIRNRHSRMFDPMPNVMLEN